MKVKELVKIGEKIMKMLHEHGINMDYYQHLPMIEEFENIFCTICVPCSSAATPTLTIGKSVASPTNAQPCCNVTNCVAITTTLNVTTGA